MNLGQSFERCNYQHTPAFHPHVGVTRRLVQDRYVNYYRAIGWQMRAFTVAPL
jgi:hypothetical protein